MGLDDIAGAVTDTVTDVAGAGKDAVENVAGAGKDAVENVVDTATDVAGFGIDTAKDVAGFGIDTAKDAAGTAFDVATAPARAVADAVTGLFGGESAEAMANPNTGTAPPGGPAPCSTDYGPDVHEVINEVIDFLQECNDTVMSIFDTVSRVLNAVPGWMDIGNIISTVNSLLQKLNSVASDIVDTIQPYLEYVGSPNKLREVGCAWVESIGATASAQASLVQPAALPTSGAWTGQAYTAYSSKAELQQAAGQEIYNRASLIDTELGKMASAITQFWVSIGIALGALVIGLAAAVAEACGVVTIPAAIATAIGVIGVYVTFVGSAVQALSTMNDSVTGMIEQVRQSLANSSAFPGGSWPVAAI
ncbi:hypothetical protein [Ruania zhangjianzhongii]|uniref:hypothetical protein n=1 Tax=Ruania zhangjianzhongii TaxID=2603206 RepID=UPI0011CC1762|nr:hypothetical protein [Ruania zhangjianzhongii]